MLPMASVQCSFLQCNAIGTMYLTYVIQYGTLTTKLPVLTGLQSYLPCWLITKEKISPCIFQHINSAELLQTIVGLLFAKQINDTY
jgi:hypothetical protein